MRILELTEETRSNILENLLREVRTPMVSLRDA